MDTKAMVNVGNYSRHGRSRGLKCVQAADHDMMPKEKLAPGGILEVVSGRSFVFFTASNKTSDFLVDGLVVWWNERRAEFPQIRRLHINIDNGPESSGHRTQFLKRAVEFAEATGLELHLAYYPPYHSKYNSIERYWGGLERSWNGYLLDTVDTVLRRAASFVWKGARTTVELFDSAYEKGVRVVGKARTELEGRLIRSPTLPWWDIIIKP